MNTTPDCFIEGIEFFVMNGEVQFIQNGVWYLFDEMDIAIFAQVREKILKDSKAVKGLELLGITDEREQVRQFIKCRFGDFTKVADITPGGEFNYEYFECTERPCPADGFLCVTPPVPHGRLTRHDCEIIRKVTQDLPNKIIAGLGHRSIETVNRQMTNIAGKIGCHTKAGIAFFAGQHNII
jgi:DNA-binding CsgD family transcriptional regulator